MMRTTEKLTRRDVLRHTVAAGGVAAIPWFVPAAARAAEDKAAPSERITLGVIGIGPRATYDLGGMLKQPDCQCVAICDVQARRRDAGKNLIDKHYGNSDCVVYRDFRELLARRDIDAVLIGTGDRWHAPASMLAAKAGKDIYSEKPCAITIALARDLAETIRGPYERLEMTPGTLTFYLGKAREFAPIRYELVAQFAGETQADATVVWNAYRQEERAVADP